MRIVLAVVWLLALCLPAGAAETVQRFDTSGSSATDQRELYGADGALQGVTSHEGDGTFEQQSSSVPVRLAQADQEQLQAEQEQEAIQSYLGLVFQKLERHKRYPRVARRSGLDGRVVLRFTVRRDGEVLDPEVVEVEGHDSFRKATLQALARVGQLPQFPDAIRRRELRVEIPISYTHGGR